MQRHTVVCGICVHILKVLYLIQIWWLKKPLKYTETIALFVKLVLDALYFVISHIIFLEVAIKRFAHKE